MLAEQHAGDQAQEEQRTHGVVLQPVVARALVQHVFEAAEEDREARNPDKVEARENLEVRFVEVDQQQREEQPHCGGDDQRMHHQASRGCAVARLISPTRNSSC